MAVPWHRTLPWMEQEPCPMPVRPITLHRLRRHKTSRPKKRRCLRHKEETSGVFQTHPSRGWHEKGRPMLLNTGLHWYDMSAASAECFTAFVLLSYCFTCQIDTPMFSCFGSIPLIEFILACVFCIGGLYGDVGFVLCYASSRDGNWFLLIKDVRVHDDRRELFKRHA
jgi:hypothetical protein